MSDTPYVSYPEPLMRLFFFGLLGEAIAVILFDFGIKDAPTTSRNPASNGICERMHLTVGNVLRTLIHSEPPRKLNDTKTAIDSALATMYITCP